jgi:multidrug efflux pump subunit AcrA (membrane-fusion protein)
MSAATRALLLSLLLALPGCGRTVPPATATTPATTAAGGGPATGSGRKILYYRNSMQPTITSPVPQKDDMGMDYVPVYADPAGPASNLPGLATVTLPEGALRLAGVTTAPAVAGTLGRSVRTSGIVVPDETRIRHVHTKISGWIEKLYVSYTGQLVRAGQPLLTIYSPELLASQQEYLRAKETAARFSSSSFPEVRHGGEELLAAARRRLELFDVPPEFLARLDRTGAPQRAVPLLARASGYAATKEAFEGQQIDPGMELFTLTDLSRVWVEANFYESEAQALHVGQPTRIALPSDPGVQLSGRVTFLSPTLAPESRTLKVRIELDNRGLTLKPGMYVDVTAELPGQPGTVVPDSAVIDSGLRQIAFVEQGPGVFVPRLVEVGLRTNGKALVLSGVAPGERVATRANFLLDSESRLRGAIEVAKPAASPAGGAVKP